MIEIIEVKSGDSVKDLINRIEAKRSETLAKGGVKGSSISVVVMKKNAMKEWEDIFHRKLSDVVNEKGMEFMLSDNMSLNDFTEALTGFAIVLPHAKALAAAVKETENMIPVPEAASFEEELEADSDEDDDWMADEVTIKGNSPKPVRKSCENIRIIRRNTLINGRYTSKAQAEKVINGMCLHTCDSLKDFKIVSVLFE